MRFALKLLEVTLLRSVRSERQACRASGLGVGVSVAVGRSSCCRCQLPHRTVRRLTTGAVAALGEPSVLVEALAWALVWVSQSASPLELLWLLESEATVGVGVAVAVAVAVGLGDGV